jgi:MFS family permease
MPGAFAAAVFAAWLGAKYWSEILPEGRRQAWRVFVYALIGAWPTYLACVLLIWFRDPWQTNATAAAFVTDRLSGLAVVAVVTGIAAYRFRLMHYKPDDANRAAYMSAGRKNSISLLVVLSFACFLCVNVAVGWRLPDYPAGAGRSVGEFIGGAFLIVIVALIAFFVTRFARRKRDAYAGLMGGTVVALAMSGLAYLGMLNHLKG